MIQIQSSDDDPDREMIQIQSSDDDPDPVMVFYDDPDPMKMTWRRRWLEDKMMQLIQRRRPVLKIVSKEYLPS